MNETLLQSPVANLPAGSILLSSGPEDVLHLLHFQHFVIVLGLGDSHCTAGLHSPFSTDYVHTLVLVSLCMLMLSSHQESGWAFKAGKAFPSSTG